MKALSILASGIVLFLTGCSERVVNVYPTYADALAEGAVDRGWIPTFLPTDATLISESHNIDIGQIAVTFTSPSTDYLASLRPVPEQRKSEAVEYLRTVDFPNGNLTGQESYYYHCSGEGVGILTWDLVSKRAHYFEPLLDEAWQTLCTRAKD